MRKQNNLLHFALIGLMKKLDCSSERWTWCVFSFGGAARSCCVSVVFPRCCLSGSHRHSCPAGLLCPAGHTLPSGGPASSRPPPCPTWPGWVSPHPVTPALLGLCFHVALVPLLLCGAPTLPDTPPGLVSPGDPPGSCASCLGPSRGPCCSP